MSKVSTFILFLMLAACGLGLVAANNFRRHLRDSSLVDAMACVHEIIRNTYSGQLGFPQVCCKLEMFKDKVLCQVRWARRYGYRYRERVDDDNDCD